MATAVTPRSDPAVRERSAARTLIPLISWTYGLGVAACLVSVLAAGLTLFVPGVLRGPAVMNGSGRGTAAVVLFLAVPLLAISLLGVGWGSARAVITWMGASAYLLYNAVLFLFITPFNQLFLFYAVMFTLNFWALVALLHAVDVPAFARRYSPTLPARALAAYIGAVGIFNGLAWLMNVVPAVLSSQAPAWLNGTGNTTNPVYAQDLAFWVPLQLIAAVWLWRREAWGIVIAGGILVFGFVEAVSIAVDQWMGSAADPGSSVASAAVAPVFLAVAALQLIPTLFYMRTLTGRHMS